MEELFDIFERQKITDSNTWQATAMWGPSIVVMGMNDFEERLKVFGLTSAMAGRYCDVDT